MPPRSAHHFQEGRSAQVSVELAPRSPPTERDLRVIPYPPLWGTLPLGTCRAESFERLAAGGDAELPQQTLHVRADGVLRDEQPGRDLVGAQVVVEQQQHLELAGAECAGDRVRHPSFCVASVPNLLAAIRGGAAGYLLKTEPPERIVEFLRGAAEGEAALSGSIARRLVEQVRDGRDAEGWVPDSIAGALSARELEVLLLLDDHLSTDQIAARLFISEHTVRSHVKSLLRKLGVSSRRQALEALGAART